MISSVAGLASDPFDRDDGRVGCLQNVVAETERFHRARLEIAGHEIGLRDELQEQVSTLGVSQVDAQAALVAVTVGEGRVHARVSVDFAKEFGGYLSVPLHPVEWWRSS